MRPVNLIPAEERRGQNAPLRTGPIAYIVLGALVALLGAVTLVVLTNNQIGERKDELTQVKREDAAATVQVQRLSAYTQYQLLSEQRATTVKSLADSRFDWERVMRELSLVLPGDVWLTGLTASASSESAASSGEGGGASLREAVAGPALEISGCATGQSGVAGFISALKDMDGVTRVGVESSALPPIGTAAGTGEGGEGGSTNCRTRDFIAEFSIVVAFDAAPVPAAEGEVAVATVEPEAAEGAEEEPASESSEG
jgi:Tfp pilus assembly protein PilN